MERKKLEQMIRLGGFMEVNDLRFKNRPHGSMMDRVVLALAGEIRRRFTNDI